MNKNLMRNFVKFIGANPLTVWVILWYTTILASTIGEITHLSQESSKILHAIPHEMVFMVSIVATIIGLLCFSNTKGNLTRSNKVLTVISILFSGTLILSIFLSPSSGLLINSYLMLQILSIAFGIVLVGYCLSLPSKSNSNSKWHYPWLVLANITLMLTIMMVFFPINPSSTLIFTLAIGISSLIIIKTIQYGLIKKTFGAFNDMVKDLFKGKFPTETLKGILPHFVAVTAIGILSNQLGSMQGIRPEIAFFFAVAATILIATDALRALPNKTIKTDTLQRATQQPKKAASTIKAPFIYFGFFATFTISAGLTYMLATPGIITNAITIVLITASLYCLAGTFKTATEGTTVYKTATEGTTVPNNEAKKTNKIFSVITPIIALIISMTISLIILGYTHTSLAAAANSPALFLFLTLIALSSSAITILAERSVRTIVITGFYPSLNSGGKTPKGIRDDIVAGVSDGNDGKGNDVGGNDVGVGGVSDGGETKYRW